MMMKRKLGAGFGFCYRVDEGSRRGALSARSKDHRILQSHTPDEEARHDLPGAS
jgi:hypothetical protein